MPEQPARARRRQPHELERQIIELLGVSPKPMGGHAIAGQLSTDCRRVVPALVFRALNALIDRREICRVECFSAYILTPVKSSILLLCRNCRNCHQIEDSGLFDAAKRLSLARGFSPRTMILEAIGRCPQCVDRCSSRGRATSKVVKDP